MKKVTFLKPHNGREAGTVEEVTELRFNYFVRTGVAEAYKEKKKVEHTEKKEETSKGKEKKNV